MKVRKAFLRACWELNICLIRSYPNSETNDIQLENTQVNMEDDRSFQNLSSPISAVFLPHFSSCCPVGYNRSLLLSIFEFFIVSQNIFYKMLFKG